MLSSFSVIYGNWYPLMHLSIVCLPPLLPGNYGKVERDFFISQQKVAPGVGHLPTPVLINTLEYTEIYLVQCSWKAFICVHNGYLHFTHRQSNSLCWPRELDYLYHYNISATAIVKNYGASDTARSFTLGWRSASNTTERNRDDDLANRLSDSGFSLFDKCCSRLGRSSVNFLVRNCKYITTEEWPLYWRAAR